MNDAATPVAPLRWRIAGHLATLAALVVLALVVAHWGWRWFGPAPVALPPAPVANDAASALVAAHLFGAGSGEAATVAAAPVSELRLLGVLAERDGRGRALFRVGDGSAKLVAVGGIVDGTTRLTAVRSDGVSVDDGRGERAIPLRVSRPADPGARSGAAGANRNPGCAVPPGFRGAVVKLNGELLQGMIRQPEAWSPIVEPRSDALVVREESGFAALLGLRKGDRLVEANGIALRSVDDVVAAVLRPLAGSQSVRVEGTRGNERRELLIQNAGTCPG